MDTLQGTIKEILSFRNKRNWLRFHTPRNLAIVMAIEVAEVQETMLWKTEPEIAEVLASRKGRDQLASEIADVLIFSLLLCDEVGVNPIGAINNKLAKNGEKYPVRLARGNATKYTNFFRAYQKSRE